MGENSNADFIRSQIDETIRQTPAYLRIRQLLKDHVAESVENGGNERAALEEILATTSKAQPLLHPLPPVHSASRSQKFVAPGAGMWLHVSLKGCRALTGALAGLEIGSINWALRASLLFRKQRYSTSTFEMVPGNRSSELQGDFFIDLGALPQTAESFAAMGGHVTFCLTREVAEVGSTQGSFRPSTFGLGEFTLLGITRELVATASVDWRQVGPFLVGSLGWLAVSIFLVRLFPNFGSKPLHFTIRS